MKITGSPSGPKGAGSTGASGAGCAGGRANAAGPAGGTAGAAASGAPASPGGTSSAAVHLSQLDAQFAQSDFNAAKVNEITSAIANGSYRVNAGAVAEKLVATEAALAGGRPQGAGA